MEEVGFKAGEEVAFGSGVERLMFPVHTSPTRLGIEQGLRGEPHRGPGCYTGDLLSEFLKPLDSVPRSRRGWYFGAQLTGRPSLVRNNAVPGPPDYQTVPVCHGGGQNKAAFNCVNPRWTERDEDFRDPGPGTYEHSVTQGRQVEMDEAFGYSRKIRNGVVMKCTNGIPEECSHCKQETVGDYFQRGKKILCSKCHQEQRTNTTSSKKEAKYEKVRDCTGVHHHKFPGKDPKIMLKSESELKKKSRKEAYFRLYYSD
ncbi:Protein pitchfork [Geodia barretti]|uniref:Protein pitchfork n=2 Tax=Geodia barretti TaxID=519541 RepID=A0AA35SU03_GEOBA|nr:Protein pitchfork [Geodia barretti]